jgi:hypothetical protein
MADTTYQPKVYRKQGGDVLVLASGGSISPETGHAIQPAPAVLGTDNAKGLFLYSPNSSSSFFANTANAKRSYLLRVEAYRPSTLPMGDGIAGVDDAAIYAIYRSYAADAAYTQQRALNVLCRHSGTSVGSVTGANIGTDISTSTVVAADVIGATISNQNYAVSTGGVSGVLDLQYTHEGANATTLEFGLRIRNAKKNGSATGAYIYLDTATSTTEFSYGLDMNAAAPATADIRLAEGMVIRSVSAAVSDNDATTLPASSIVLTSNNTGKGKIFVSDGSNLQVVTTT